MANSQNVELEAARFLHKLIQESKDEPTKLAAKLYVILQHMRSSGKENSMPYQVISRAMETVIKQHNLDIEALMSSRLPVAAGAEVGDSTSSQLAGPSQRAGVANNALANEPGRLDAPASSRGQVGPTVGGQDIHQGNASPSSGATKLHGGAQGASGSYAAVDSGISNPMHFGSPIYDNHGFAPKMHNEKITEAYSATPSFDLSACKSAGKAVDHGGGTNIVEHKAIQGSVVNSAPETSMLKSVAPRDPGKSPASTVPFKEQQLRQLRAQCLVFLAFRNGLMPKKLHLEIALGNIMSKDDGQRREQSVSDPNNVSEVTRPFGRESDRVPPGSSSGEVLAETNSSKEAENSNMEDRSGLPIGLYENVEDGKNHFTKKSEAEEATESQSFPPRGLPRDSNIRGLAVVHNRNDLKNTGQQNGISNQASVNVPTGHPRKDSAHDHSPAERNYQASRFAEINLPSFQSREQWTSISGMDSQNASALPVVKDTGTMMNNTSQVHESEPEEDDNSMSADRPPSPKYTTVDKWILDRQKRKVLCEQKRAQKQQKTEQKIVACFGKLKENVSSSEDIFSKTKSMIELKKLQLLGLQRRLRSDILSDFFKPIATDMERLKSIKKTRIGRKSKQLERYEQRMKEERQKRFRERQKEFFSEIEVHRERLEDIFKQRRERWKGFNRYAREFHKKKERIHREKIDRIQREKINLLKINDVEGYLRMVQDAKSDRVKQLLKETEKYLSKLGAKLQQAKVMTRRFETEMDENRSTGVVEKSDFDVEDEDDTDQAKHYLESNEKYYLMAHSIKENIGEQPTCLVGGKLREYQMNGLRWLVSLYNNHLNGILADEMGLGKTVQVISLICYLMENKNDRGPFLVVVPSSVLPGWETEINFWAPSIHKIVYSGPPEERRRLFKEQIVHQKFNVLLTTYEYLMNKHDRPKLSKVHWHYIIIDEGHRIKNASCKLNADLKHYRSNHRLLLTGTPLQNNLEELWALLNFLLPNIFNSSEDFSQWFNKPFESNGDNSADEALLSEEENLLIINRLHQVLRPFVLRRLKHKVENQLPSKIERLIRCEASSYQKLLMKRVEENLGAFGTTKARSVHNSVMELRNICNHPYLSQLHVEEVHDFIPKHYLPNIVRLCGKLEMLDRLLPKLKATDHRVLLFSTMTRLLDIMEDYLYWKQYKYLRLDGHTSGGERGALIDNFNRPGSPYFIFLLSIRAGGVGVNLQAADTVIIFDTDWNPQVDLQAQARAHRIGQKKDVLVLRLETVQTVEEQVRAAAEHKLGVANQSITAGFFDNNTSAEDRREYLESLLRECKKEEAAPVLDDDALNDLIARSESEIDVFESVDNRRREDEMAAWKQLVTEKEAESSPLPPRLLTDDELKAFSEAMKITEEPHPEVTSSAGMKRKGGIAGLDTQHYGRGKRARDVRSYEEQWTEEEFERMCQVDYSGSPNLENLLPTVASGSVVAGSLKLEAPTLQPQLQPPFDATGQQNKEVTPPSKRGRGRPRRNVPAPNIPAPVALSAPAVVGKVEPGSAAVNASAAPSAPAVVGKKEPVSMAVNASAALSAPAVVGKMEPVSMAVNASAALSAPAVVVKMEPGSVAVNASVGLPTPAVVGSMAPGSAANASVSLPPPAVDGKMEAASMAVKASTSSVSHGPDSLPSSTPVRSVTGNVNQVDVFAAPNPHSTPPPFGGPVSQSTLIAPPAKGRGRGRKVQTGEAPRRRGKKTNVVLQDVPATSLPSESVKPAMVNQGIASATSSLAAPDLQPVSSSSTSGEPSKELTAVSSIPVLPSSSSTERPGIMKQEIAIPSPSIASDPQPAACSASLVEVTKEPNAVSPVPVLQSSSVIEKGNVGVPRESISYSLVSGPESFPGFPIVISTDKEDCDVSHAPASELPSSSSSVVPASQPILSQSEPKPGRGRGRCRGRGRGRQPQVEGEAPRRRGRRQESATPIVPTGSVDQDPKSVEPPQKRSRVSAAGRRASARGKQDIEPQVLTTSIQLTAAQTTSGPSVGQDHNVEQENRSKEDTKQDVSRGCTDPALGHADAEHSIAIMKDSSRVTPSPETKKDAFRRSEYRDSQTIPATTVNEVSGPDLCGNTSSVLSESTAQSSDLKDADSRSRQSQQPINASRPCKSLTPQDPSIGQICIPDGKSNITETKEVQPQMPLSEATFKESLEATFEESLEATPNVPSSSKTHISISTHSSETPVDEVADDEVSEVREEVGKKAVPLDKLPDEICKSECRIDNEEGTVRVDDRTSEISEIQAKNEDGGKAGQMQNPRADKTSDLLAPSAPASDFSFVQSDCHVGKFGDLEKEEPADSGSINNALNNSVDLSKKGGKSDKKNRAPSSCDVFATVLGLPSFRSSELADSITDEMTKGQAKKEDAKNHELAHNALVDGASDLLSSGEAASDLSVQRDGHSGNQEDKEKDNPALNNSLYVSAKDDVIDQDNKDSVPCNASQLNSDTMASTPKPAADTDEMSEGQAIKDDVEESQLDETSALLDCSAPASNLSLHGADSHSGPLEDQEKEDNALTKAPDSNLPTVNGASPNVNTALSNSVEEDSTGQEITDPVPPDASESNLDLPASNTCCENVKDQTLDGSTASAFSSSNVVGRTEEMCGAPADKEVEKERQTENTLLDESTPMLSASAPTSDLSLVPAVSHSSKPDVLEKDDPCLPDVPISETEPRNIEIAASDNPKDPSSDEAGMDQESHDCSTSDAADLNSNLPASCETCIGDIQEQCLDDTLESTVSAPIVDNNLDEVCVGLPSRDDMETDEGQVQHAAEDKTSDLPLVRADSLEEQAKEEMQHPPTNETIDLPLVRADSLENQGKEDPALMEVLVSDIPTTDAVSPSMNIAFTNSGDLSEEGDRSERQSKEHVPCGASGSNMDLSASTDTCCEVVKDQTLDDTSASPHRSSAIVGGTTDELCEGQDNKKAIGEEGQFQNTPAGSAPVAPALDLLPIPADSHSDEPEDRQEPAPTKVLAKSSPTMETASTVVEIPLNKSEDSSGKDDMLEKERMSSAPYDDPDFRLAASTENCGEDVKDEKLDDASTSASRSPGMVDCATAETCEGLGSKEDGFKGGDMQGLSIEETSVMLAPGSPTTETPAAGSGIPLDSSNDLSGKEVRLDQESKDSVSYSVAEVKPELPVSIQPSCGDAKDETVDIEEASVILTPGSPTTEIPTASSDIPLNSSSDLSGREDRLDQESKDSTSCSIVEVKPDVPVSIQASCGDKKDETVDIEETSVILAPGSPTTETLAANSDIPLNSSSDLSGKEDRLDEESKDSMSCSIVEVKPDLPVSIQASTGDCKDETVDNSHGSASPLRSTGADESTTNELGRAQAVKEDVTKVGEMKNSSVDENFDPSAPVGPVADLLQEKKDPGASEVCGSDIESATPSACIAHKNSDTLPEEQTRINKENDDLALEGSDLGKNVSSPERLLPSSPTLEPEASSLASPISESEYLSAEEAEEENKNRLADAPLGSKPEIAEVGNSSAEGQDPPAL